MITKRTLLAALTGVLVGLLLAGCVSSPKCKPSCPADQRCVFAWTESSGPFATSTTHGPAACRDVSRSTARAATLVPVIRTVDGDTIVVEEAGKKEYVRLLGVNTPETHKPRWPVERCGPEAEQFTRGVLPRDTHVMLVVAGDKLDKYGRTLAYVQAGDMDLNLELIKRGYAHAQSYGHEHPRRLEFEAAEREAKAAHAGCLWH
jgi:micrococcal nuclease